MCSKTWPETAESTGPSNVSVHLEADDGVELAHEAHDVVADAAALVAHPELVNGRTHLGDDPVDLRDRAAQLARRGIG